MFDRDLNLDRAAIFTALQKGNILLQGQFLRGSNYTFMVEVCHEDIKFKAVYKPLRGEQPLWDFPPGTLCKREVAAWVVSDLLGWDLVPPTVFRRKGALGSGSLQLYVDHDPNYHYFNFSDEDHQRLRPVALFDHLINNADRKGSHILKSQDGHLWLIDHGICFHIEDKLRTVVWDFAGEPIPADLLEAMRRLVEFEQSQKQSSLALKGLLRPGEISAMITRAMRMITEGSFPLPAGSRRSYPWPPV